MRRANMQQTHLVSVGFNASYVVDIFREEDSGVLGTVNLAPISV